MHDQPARKPLSTSVNRVTHAGANEQLGFVERTEPGGEFRAPDHHLVAARVRRLQRRIDRNREGIAAPAGGGLEPIGPMHRVLHVDPNITLVELVTEGVEQELALEGVVQGVADSVIASLQAEQGLVRRAEQLPVDGARHTSTGIDAVFILMNLITGVGTGERRGDRIGSEPKEVVEEVQGVGDEIGISFPQSVGVGLRPSGGQRVAAGVAAVGRILLAQKPDLSVVTALSAI
jgi:hypothetical protein